MARLALGVGLIALAAHPAWSWSASESDFKLGMRTLVVGSGRETDIPELVLEAYNTDWKSSSGVPDLSSPEYQAIIVADSGISGGEISKIRKYCAKYGARVVFLNASPGQCGASSGGGSGDNVVFDSSAPDSITGILNTNSGWDVSGGRAASSSGVTPIMRFSGGSGRSSSGGVAAFVNKEDGCEQMCFTFDATRHELVRDRGNLAVGFSANKYAMTSLALGHMWFPWATHGMFIGQRRMFLGVQIDDWFIASGLWKPSGEGANFRIDGGDCRTMVSNMASLSNEFPSGSKIKFEPAINGVGISQNNWEDWEKKGRGLNACSRSNQDKFFWVSHTWTHQHLDWSNGDDCDKGGENTCKTPYSRQYCETKYNIDLMEGKKVSPGACFPGEDSTPAGAFKLRAANWSPRSLVTPEISGLVPPGTSGSPKRVYGRPGNSDAFRAMKNNGIKYVVGDNSRPELMPMNPYHMKAGQMGVYLIPRHAPSVPYNCDTPDCLVRQWKSDDACEYTPGPSCGSFALNFESAIRRDVRQFLPYMLALRWDPYMFHQANAAATVNGGQYSIISYWTKVMAEELGKYIGKFPVVSRKMDDLGDAYKARMSRDNCNINGDIIVSGGQPKSISVRGSGCTALVSFTKDSGANPSGVKKERYGSDVTAKVSGSKTFSI